MPHPGEVPLVRFGQGDYERCIYPSDLRRDAGPNDGPPEDQVVQTCSQANLILEYARELAEECPPALRVHFWSRVIDGCVAHYRRLRKSPGRTA